MLRPGTAGLVAAFRSVVAALLLLAAQGYDQGSGADQEEGGDGGADADE